MPGPPNRELGVHSLLVEGAAQNALLAHKIEVLICTREPSLRLFEKCLRDAEDRVDERLKLLVAMQKEAMETVVKGTKKGEALPARYPYLEPLMEILITERQSHYLFQQAEWRIIDHLEFVTLFEKVAVFQPTMFPELFQRLKNKLLNLPVLNPPYRTEADAKTAPFTVMLVRLLPKPSLTEGIIEVCFFLH